MANDNTTAPAGVNLGGEDPAAEIARLKAENQSLKDAKASERIGGDGTFTVKTAPVGAKIDNVTKKAIPGETSGGNIRHYGVGRLPITMFLSQQLKFLRPENVVKALEASDKGFADLSVKGKDAGEIEANKKAQREELTRLLKIYRKVEELVKAGKL